MVRMEAAVCPSFQHLRLTQQRPPPLLQFLFCTRRGAEETSTAAVTKKLFQCALTSINQRLRRHCPGKGKISFDVDAWSVAISTDDMTSLRRDRLRQFLLHFGEGLGAGSSLPNRPIGPKIRRDGMFGCRGNHCQHLPTPLDGREILVIDSPVKIAIHESCKDDLIVELKSDHQKYFSPSPDRSGICFNPYSAANKPDYQTLIDAIINTSRVKSGENRHYIHAAQLGCRSPIGWLGLEGSSQIFF